MLASVLRHRSTLRVDWVIIIWAVVILTWLLVFWLGSVNTYRLRATDFTTLNFGILLLSTIALYFSAALVLPAEINADTDLRAHFNAVRRPFFIVLAAIPALELLDSIQYGFQHLIETGYFYIFSQVAGVAGCVIGIITKSRRVQGVLSILFLLVLLVWLFTKLYTI